VAISETGSSRVTDVLIAGAGPVGLALAIELGLRSVRCVVVEQHDRVGLNPRAGERRRLAFCDGNLSC
jgi:2-polyprenyl-6-methoxyphenol hydroxylase-like FAD-dependent oxidoreductase